MSERYIHTDKIVIGLSLVSLSTILLTAVWAGRWLQRIESHMANDWTLRSMAVWCSRTESLNSCWKGANVFEVKGEAVQ